MERYDRYKDSGIEWIGEIPSNWKILPLKYCYNFKTGFTPDTKQYEYYDPNGYDWATISDLGGSEIRNTETRISQRFVDEFNPVPILKGSLLYSFKLSAGKVAFAGKDLFTNEAIASFLPNNPCLCFLKYSSYLISFAANENIYGAKLLNASLIKNALMVFPPISVQEKIASFLDEKTSVIDSLIQKNEKSIELLQDYRKSVISEAVTKGLDPNVPMKDSGAEWIGEIPKTWGVFRNKLLFKLRDERNTQPLSKVNLLSLYTDLGVVQHKDLTKTTGNKATNANGYKVVYPSDIVVNIILCWMGAIGVSAYSGVVSPAYDVYSAKRLINPKYYHYLFRTKQFGDECYLFGRGIMQMRWRVYSDQFLNIKVPCPDYSTQCLIVDYLDQKTSEIDSLIEKKKQLVEKLQEYRRSLISECVTGKVKVPGVE